MYGLAQVRSVLYITLGLNIAVSCAKLLAGFYFRSISMIADGFHSLFDASSNIIGLAGMKIAGKPPDESHPYGHKKYETFAAMLIGVMLFGTCFEILKRAYASFTGGAKEGVVVGVPGFAVMFLTMAVNIFVTRYEAKKGRELGSDFLLADAAHTKSDIIASMSVIASLVAVKLGYPWADPFFAVVIAIMIGRVGFQIMKASSDILCDSARIRSEDIIKACMSVPGVLRCHQVRSRGREDEVCVDLRVHVDPALSTSEAHKIADMVEEMLMKTINGVKDVVVHIEPEE